MYALGSDASLIASLFAGGGETDAARGLGILDRVAPEAAEAQDRRPQVAAVPQHQMSLTSCRTRPGRH
jgi:hypothetical protein